MSLALALDLGTTSIAAVAVDEQGRLVAHVQLPNDAAVTGLPAGYAEQNPLRIRELAWQLLQQLATVLPALRWQTRAAKRCLRAWKGSNWGRGTYSVSTLEVPSGSGVRDIGCAYWVASLSVPVIVSILGDFCRHAILP
jgi:hypothetical protein